MTAGIKPNLTSEKQNRAVVAAMVISQAAASLSSLDEVKETVAKLRGRKVAGACSMSAEVLRAGGETMTRELHVFLTSIWQSGTFPPD